MFRTYATAMLLVGLALSACGGGDSDESGTTAPRVASVSGADDRYRVRIETDGRQVIIAVADDARASAAESAGEDVRVLCASADAKQQGNASWPAVGDQITVKLTPAGEPASYCVAENREGGDLACVTFDESRDWCQTSPKDTGTVEDLVIE